MQWSIDTPLDAISVMKTDDQVRAKMPGFSNRRSIRAKGLLSIVYMWTCGDVHTNTYIPVNHLKFHLCYMHLEYTKLHKSLSSEIFVLQDKPLRSY